MDTKDIIDLIKTINNTDIRTVEIEKKDIKVMISKNIESKESRKNTPQNQEIVIEEKQIEEEIIEVEDIHREDEDLFTIQSPVVGVFYESPNPDADPFGQIGDFVEEGDTLCIVEAMKIMNEIESEVSGEIVEILVENEDVVEYGQPLMRIRR